MPREGGRPLRTSAPGGRRSGSVEELRPGTEQPVVLVAGNRAWIVRSRIEEAVVWRDSAQSFQRALRHEVWRCTVEAAPHMRVRLEVVRTSVFQEGPLVEPSVVVGQLLVASALHLVHRQVIVDVAEERRVLDVGRRLSIAHIEARREATDDAVPQLHRGAAAHQDAVVLARQLTPLAAERRVVDAGAAGGTDPARRWLVVAFQAIASRGLLRRHLPDQELQAPRVAEVPVERVVAWLETCEVLRVHRTAEELEAVVCRVSDEHVIDHRPATDCTQAEAVDFVVGGDLVAAVLDAHVPQGSAAVVGVRAAVLTTFGEPFDARTHGATPGIVMIGGCAPEDDDAPPVSGTSLTGRRRGRED